MNGEREAGLLPEDTIRLMLNRLPNQSKGTLMDMFGISANTWVKRQPVCSSLTDGLHRRIITIQPEMRDLP